MDKNTITGLVLIAILLVGFSFLSRPSQEQLEAQQRYYDSIAQVQQREADLKAKAEAAPWQALTVPPRRQKNRTRRQIPAGPGKKSFNPAY